MIRGVKKWGAAATAVAISMATTVMAHAQGIILADPLGGQETFTSVATAVAEFLFWDIATPLSVIMVLVGAFQLITSSGDPEKVSKGRKTIMYAAIGLAVALLAGSVVNIVKSFVGAS